MTYRVCVCGGRDYMDTAECFAVLDAIHAERPITAIVHGGATGADLMGERWALHREIHTELFPVSRTQWEAFGKAAGPMRNAAMLSSGVDLVVAFPGGRGTADCVRQARKLGIPIHGDTAEVKR